MQACFTELCLRIEILTTDNDSNSNAKSLREENDSLTKEK